MPQEKRLLRYLFPDDFRPDPFFHLGLPEGLSLVFQAGVVAAIAGYQFGRRQPLLVAENYLHFFSCELGKQGRGQRNRRAFNEQHGNFINIDLYDVFISDHKASQLQIQLGSSGDDYRPPTHFLIL